MYTERLMDRQISRRHLFKLAFASALAHGINTAIAHADEIPAPNESLIPLISAPLESNGTPQDRLWGQTRAEQHLEIPEDSSVELLFSITAQIPPNVTKIQGAGLLIDNGLRMEDPNFSKIMIARLANSEGDLWGLLQQSGRNMRRVLVIAPGSESMDFVFNPPLNGIEGTVIANGEESLKCILEKPFINTGRLTFSAYSEGQAISTILKLEARLKNPQ